MFLCARGASTSAQAESQPSLPPPKTSDDLCAVSQASAPRQLHSTRPQGRPKTDDYLQLLDALTSLLAELLHVHRLSPALRFSAGEDVAVDAQEWWQEVQRQSVTIAQQEDANNRPTRETKTESSSLWGRGSKLSEKQVDKVKTAAKELQTSSFFVQALYLVMKTLERVNRRRTEQGGQVGLEQHTVIKALASVDEGVAFAAAQLLQKWAAMDFAAAKLPPSLSKLMSVAVVNALLQARQIGTRHTFHEHTLLPTLARRAFSGTKQWKCSVCDRVASTISSDAARVACVYRCAACNFNLCRECFTRIPNVAGPRRNDFSGDSNKLAADRFFDLVVPQLEQKEGAVVVRQIALELRRRVLELYPHNFQGAADFGRIFHELIASDTRAAIALVSSPPAVISSTKRPTVAWFPMFMRTWTMSQSTLLGPFLRASTMLDDTHELDAAVRAAKHGSGVADSLRGQWTHGYSDLRKTMQALMRTLLGDKQHAVVVDATLCWLALTLLTADPRRHLNYDVRERLDGFLVNVTTMLLAHALPLLSNAQHDPGCIDSSYHQSVEPVRVCASKDFPEVPLHYSRSTQDARSNESIIDAEIAEIRARDEGAVAEYNARRMQRSEDDGEAAETAVPFTFYPRLSGHEGVVCDRCEFQNFHNVRYKCAFCADMDLCSACYEDFRSHQASPLSGSSSSEADSVVHNVNHVFLRIETPIPVFALKHFQPLPEELLTTNRKEDNAGELLNGPEADAPKLHCADCGDALGLTEQPDDVFYQCANCFSPRTLCVTCLTREEKLSHGNPHNMHAPGHVYFVVTDPWRRQLPVPWGNVMQKLHFRRLLHPPALIPRLRFPLDTEVFYMTLKYLHFGPLSTLSRWLSMVKELHELQAFCNFDDERLEVENQRRQRRRHRHRGSQRQSLKPSVHYKASKARLDDLRVKCVRMELHLLDSANVAAWLVFYGRACRWLLHIVQPDSASGDTVQDPFARPLTEFSPTFSGFPEHFFFDLCDVVYLLGLEKLDYRDLVTELRYMRRGESGGGEAVDEVTEVIEPLLVMLAQIVTAPKFTKNPHLRVEALRSLTTLLTFVAKGQQAHHRPGHCRIEALFKSHELLSRWLIPGLLQFHHDMDRYNASNNGLAFTSAVTSGDHMLWGFLPTRVSVTMLLRFLWQLPSQRKSLLQTLNASDIAAASQTMSVAAQTANDSTEQLTGLVSGLWSDIAKLFDEANSKITTLRQIHDLIEDSLDGSVVVLPFRRDMLDGYVAINSKQLRLTLRLLLEALELTSWLASIVSGENSFRSRSLSAPAAALGHVLLQPLVVEQAARTISFLVASLANAHEEKEWTFSHPLVEDGKLLLAHLIVLVVRYAGHNAVQSSDFSGSRFCSPSSFWKIVRASGEIVEGRVGDLDTKVRWGLNALCTRIESESYLGSTSLDDDDDDDVDVCLAAEAGHELDEDEALALLEKQASSAASSAASATMAAQKRLGKRFVATLAKDGRFDFRLFVGGCRFLRPPREQNASSSDSDSDEEPLSVEDGYLYLDDSWVQQFVRAMQEADEMIHVQEAMEACLGDIPDQYLDPLLSTLMTDPVRLPSGNIVDRAVIARHLLASSQQGGSTGRDPFTREPLTMEMVEPCDALRSEIQLYLRSKMRHFRKTAREDVLATWGLGWDVLFDASCSETEADADSEDGVEGNGSAATPSS